MPVAHPSEDPDLIVTSMLCETFEAGNDYGTEIDIECKIECLSQKLCSRLSHIKQL